MFAEIAFEGLTLPSTFGLDDVKGDPSEQIFEGGADSDAVRGESLQVVGFGDAVDPRDQDVPG